MLLAKRRLTNNRRKNEARFEKTAEWGVKVWELKWISCEPNVRSEKRAVRVFFLKKTYSKISSLDNVQFH